MHQEDLHLVLFYIICFSYTISIYQNLASPDDHIYHLYIPDDLIYHLIYLMILYTISIYQNLVSPDDREREKL